MSTMWKFAGIAVVVLLMIIFELPKLVKETAYKEMILFSVLLLAGTGLCILEALQIEYPTPLDFISVIYEPVSQFIFRTSVDVSLHLSHHASFHVLFLFTK
ncbi:hypothetical protein [Marinicrinis sediminis]|uniref:Uncharacterized protein n=1 Tax=Marinicrinis sediminis TaxID=1652465 RepID=A0ABW5REL6_9BACL